MSAGSYTLQCITDVADLEDKRVLVRLDLNVPLEGDKVRSVFRIKKVLRTLEHLHKQGARTIILAHIGRDKEETLQPVHAELTKSIPIRWAGALVGPTAERAIGELRNGDILMLENLRSDTREMENEDSLARELAAYGDLYVDDAFSAAHRAHASVVGIPQHLPSYAGIQFIDEYTNLARSQNPELPALFVLGGAKFVTKAPLVSEYVERYDHVFVGGALANDFFKAMGYEIGDSMFSDIDLSDSPLLNNKRVLLPIDVTVSNANGKEIKNPEHVAVGDTILDAGPETMTMLLGYLKEAHTILWNGPLGDYENGFQEYTEAFAQALAAAPGFSVVGGGDTVAAIESLGLNHKFGFLSTAGGAMLQFLELGTLPGIEALLESQKKHG